MSPEETLAEIAREINQCTKCDLHYSRKKGVPGEGPSEATIMFIGEGPGFHENEHGRPFVGAAGRFLDELLNQAGLKREEVFIGNVVKCRPPGNRDPIQEELKACSSFLDRQIHVINPRVIVTLGRFSMEKFFPNAKISQVHGQAMQVRDRLIIPMYHPAAALHQPSLKSLVEVDFTKLTELIATASEAPEYQENVQEEDEPKQLSLF